jgi:hypothetical protein
VGRSKMWICANLLWTKQIGEFFRLVVAEMHAHTVMNFFFFYEKRISRSHRRRQTVRTVFPTVDERSSGPSEFCNILSRALQFATKRATKRQRARRCLYRGHSDAKVKI